MKTLLTLLVLLSVLTGCGSSSSNPTRPQAGSNHYILGKVTAIQPGKDGYTARLVTAEGKVYFATISIANLKENAAQYRSAAVGDTLRLRGDVWQAGDETHVTVRELAK
jgi:hypothetical protein